MRPPPPRPRSNAPLVLGLAGFVGVMFMVPLFLHRRSQRLQGGAMWSSEKPLGPTEARRGTYLNTGSHDVGPDPDWDHEKYLYKGRAPAVIDETTGLSASGSASMRAQPGTSLGRRT